MISKQINDIILGQISIFDLELDQQQKPKDELKPIVIPVTRQCADKFAEIINQYSSTAARIVKRVSGALLVELEDKTLYFNSDGVKELELKKDLELMPADEIIVVNKDRELNDLQLEKLEDMHATQYIKRKGDGNIIILFPGKTVIINPEGWVLDYLQKPKYHDNELFIKEMAKESTDLDINITKSVNEDTGFESDKQEKLEVGDKVEFNYAGPQIGNVSRIYNNGETVNVVWNKKSTAFYYRCVKKIS